MIRSSAFTGNEYLGIDSLEGPITVVNSTVDDNGFGIRSTSILRAIHTTLTGNREAAIYLNGGTAVLAGTLVDGVCTVDEGAEVTWVSNGYNIESPGDTCGLDPDGTDLVGVSADDLKLDTREPNGGPTDTHALLPGSVAIDRIPAEDCVDADGAPLTTDQRGEPRPETGGTMCDVGAFEVQP